VKSAIQNLLLITAGAARRHGLITSGPGRWLYDHSYELYKLLLEAPGINRLQTLVRPNEWIFDVGANVGFFARRFATWVDGEGRVIAIEPEPANMARLKLALGRAGVLEKVDLVEAAAVGQDGEVRLTLNPSNPADHRIGATGISVQGVTLDGLSAARGSPRVGLIKMDIQGAEWSALQGAQNLLTRDQPALFIELADEALAPWGVTGADVTHNLIQLGYRPHLVNRRGISTPRTEADIARLLDKTWYVDVLFLTPERAAAVSQHA